MDHLFEFTSAVTREFFRLVTEEGVTTYEEDDGRLATLAVKNVLAKRDFTVIGTEHYKEILNNYWLDEPAVLRSIRDKFTEYNAEAPPETDRAALAMNAIADAMADCSKLIVNSEHLAELNAKAHPDEPPTVIIDKTGAISFQSEGLVVRDYRKGDVCAACGDFRPYADLVFIYVPDQHGHIGSRRSSVCNDCMPDDDGLPF